MSKAKYIGWAAAATVVVIAASTSALVVLHKTPAQAEAAAAPPASAAHSGGNGRRSSAGYVGAGWSLEVDTEVAVSQAVARASPDGPTGLTMLFYTPQHDRHRVAEALARARHGQGHSVAMTSHDGILTSDGYHSAETGVVGALTIDLEETTSGVGAASFDEGTPGDAARLALGRAMVLAHKTKADKPSLLVVFCTVRQEEKVLAGIAAEIGADVPLVGGTAAGLVSAMERKTKDVSSSIIVDDTVIERGVAVTAFYSAKPFALAFGGGFDKGSRKGGVITSSDSRLIKAIDGRPAVDVYDEWLGGRLSEARGSGKNVQNMLALYPLVQTVGEEGHTHNQFIRAWPSGDQGAPGSLTTGADVHDGETVYTSEGSENILLNRFASLPRQARLGVTEQSPAAGLFFYCAGALQTIPREHRGVLAALVQRSMGDIPWIGLFSWGEQGSVPGVGYQHGNLMASTVLFPGLPGN